MERTIITSVDLMAIVMCPMSVTKILKPIYATLREKEHLNVGYIKDSYLQYGMIHECQSNITDTCCLFTRLGFVIHSVKSVLGPVETQFKGHFVRISLSTTVYPPYWKCVWHQRAVPWAY